MTKIKIILTIILLSILFLGLKTDDSEFEIEFIITTFLGNEQRNFYGTNPPVDIEILWKTTIGCGETVIPNVAKDTVKMCGAGWTGQALMIRENNELFLIQGCYDYKFKKINAENGKIIWEYSFNDVIKGTPCIWKNPYIPDNHPDKYVIFAGARAGIDKNDTENFAYSYRAISYLTGKELWRYYSQKTECYSQDVDGTALINYDTLYLGLENGYFIALNPNIQSATNTKKFNFPKEIFKIKLYNQQDLIDHNNNVVIESAPSFSNDKIFITSGAGYLYGFNTKTKNIDFSFKIGSDIDGSPVITKDGNVLVAVEKQYIKGKGGMMLIDPRKHQDYCVVWYFPVRDTVFYDWQGGIIGTAAINDQYIDKNRNSLTAFVAVDGFTYVVETELTEPNITVPGPNNITQYKTPQLVFKYYTGPSISTPIFFDDKLFVLTYQGIYMFGYDENCNFTLLKKKFVNKRRGNPYCSRQKTLCCFT